MVVFKMSRKCALWAYRKTKTPSCIVFSSTNIGEGSFGGSFTVNTLVSLLFTKIRFLAKKSEKFYSEQLLQQVLLMLDLLLQFQMQVYATPTIS